MQKELHFSIHGNYITDFIRGLVSEGSIQKAWNVFETITKDKSIFKSIVKGKQAFEGVNDLHLINTRNEDVAEEAFSSLLRQLSSHKQELNQLSNDFDDKKLDSSLEDLVKIKNQIDKEIKECESQISLFRQFMDYTDEDIKLSILYKYTSKDLSSPYGWVTEKGWFIPIEFQGHDAFIYQYNEQVQDNLTVESIEKRWVRITQSFGTIGISALGFKPTAKQEATVLKWAKHHNILKKDGDYLHIHHSGMEICLENGQYKIVKYK